MDAHVGLLGPSRLTLLRHAEVDNQQGRRFMGRTDLPLTSRGADQAKALAARFAGLPPCPVYASPLRRARSTAEALETSGLPPAEVLEDLRELDFGLWEGRLAEDVAREEPGSYARWRAVDPGFAFPRGDALAATARRMADLLERLWPAEGGHAIVVAHGGVLRLGLCELLGLPWAACPRLRLDFTGVTRLERHAGRVVLAGLNDTTHLPPGSLS